MAIALPPPDRQRSPITGWTRAHWEAVADRLLDAVTPFAGPDHAQIRLPGRASRAGVISDGLEGFARTFLLAAFRIAGSGPQPPAQLIDRYTRGLTAGTDPAHPFAWPPPVDMSQQLVEAASIALALHETRPWIFDRLPPSARERVVAWLAGCIGRRTPDSNWVLFKVVVEQFLANVGALHDPAEITGGLDRVEAWYAGDGWYSDGTGHNFDYYNGWALHLYPMLWARMSGDRGRAARYADRLRLFLAQYQHFFAADGAPVHQGRSLTYRFATVAPLWLGALTEATPLEPGVTRRIASGALRHFVERGAPDERGLLTLGWYHEFPPMAQRYSGPGSPYWAAKAFLGLLLPADHPVWTVPERPAPIDTADTVLALPAPGWLLHTTRDDGIVRLVNHGSDRADRPQHGARPDPNYVRLAYTTATGPVLDAGDAVDGHLAVIAPDGSVSQRRRIERIATDAAGYAASRYTDGAVRVTTVSVVDGPHEVRVHLVEAPAGHQVREGGHPLSGPQPPAGDGEAATVRAGGLVSLARPLAGFTAAGVARARDATAFGPHTATPYLLADHAGGARLYCSVIVLAGGHFPAAGRPQVLRAGDDRLTLAMADGTTVHVRIAPGSEPVVVFDTWRCDGTPASGAGGGHPPHHP
ncbi:DUF2264 domain-containing protein [Dactylosporangium sp. NPDC051541]|uniref:DUF2264 domain-containing protein n=1 Tax=Dactylosporangium sp. NPDC051541 TaxID=3363977 RepID=UPI003792D327